MNILELKNKSFEKKELLIQAALDEFGDHSYDDASINIILKRANISKGAFYHHFKNKEGLYLFLVSIIADQKNSFFKNNYSVSQKTDFFEVLFDLVKIALQFIHQNPKLSKFSNQFLKEKNSTIMQKIYGHNKGQLNNNEYLTTIITNAYNNGMLRTDLPLDFVKNMINYLFIHLNEITQVYSIDEYEEAAKHVISFMKNGFSK